MAEKIVSPGVFTNEIDQSALPAGIANIGAALIGPTHRGPANIPTTVTSYSDFVAKFGSVFTVGTGTNESTYKYLTNYSAQEYLKYADTLTVVRTLPSDSSTAFSNVVDRSGTGTISFRLDTLSVGAQENSGISAASTVGSGSSADQTTGGRLISGTETNLRWEVSNVSTTKGTFTLLIRRGDDITNRKIILEQYNNLTLDPTSPNYIAKRVGDVSYTLLGSGTSDPYFQVNGSYPNVSRYVRVSNISNTTVFFDQNGKIRIDSLSGSLPQEVSGTFSGGSNGTEVSKSFFENIFTTNALSSTGAPVVEADHANRHQGLDVSMSIFRNAYLDAINLLSNQDDYDFNLLTLPGLIDENTFASSILTSAQQMVEGRGDAFLVMDPVKYGSSLSNVVSIADNRNSNYVAMYWPWVLINDSDLGRAVWVPASTVVPSVYAFNDRVAAPWFAPAGLNRGGIDVAIRTERKLDQSNRDTLYDANINPIASFPNLGVAVYGQKTLQKKASALDRVNVRRLLIAAKKFVASTSKYLIFENNTAATRNRFLSIVNPYFDNVQQRQGLYAFKVVMDEKLNTPEVIDRNELRGAIYLQPTKTAEFIIIDFNVLPTGAAFPE
jgi:phage tail sheath protein FI